MHFSFLLSLSLSLCFFFLFCFNIIYLLIYSLVFLDDDQHIMEEVMEERRRQGQDGRGC